METNRVCFWNAGDVPEVFARSGQGRQARLPWQSRNDGGAKPGGGDGRVIGGAVSRTGCGKSDSLILVPIESPEAGAEVIELAIEIAQKANGKLLLVHAIALNVAEYGPANPKLLKTEEHREMERELAECVAFSQKAEVPANYIITEGSIPAVIGRVACEQHPALIVLSSKRAGRLAMLVSRHTVKKVVQIANCPVLVIQHGK